MHLFGQMEKPKRIENFCKNNKIILIEDVAQSFGASRDNIIAGSIGRMAVLALILQ